MFVYQGKFKWFYHGQDETFVVVLPNGFVRDGDTAYLFSQWTEDAQKRQKNNWFQTLIVSGLTKNSDGDDSFSLKGAYYTWTITTQKVYSKLNITMSNPQKDKSTMAVDHNEPAIFIIPDGFGDGKPVLSLWQWTKDSKGQVKAPEQYKFSYNSYYDITCTWDQKTEKLAVHMKEGGNLQQDVADLNLSGKIDRERPGHQHSFSPPQAAPQKAEVSVRLPQAQASLRRLLAPLPFPGNLIDTLEHTYAFLDQAGYYARYAQDRFAALDADYHVQLQLVDALQKENINVKDQIKTLADDLTVAKAKSDELKKQLEGAKAEAKSKEDELRKQIAELQTHGVKDHKILDSLHKEVHAALNKISHLEKKLSDVALEKKTLLAQIKTLQGTVKGLESKKTELENSLKAERQRNEALRGEKRDLNKWNKTLQGEKDALQEKLAKIEAELAKTKYDLKTTSGKLEAANYTIEIDKDKISKKGEHLDHLRKRLADADRAIGKYEDRLVENRIKFDDIKDHH
ncbi:hypothetical protein FALBO_14554 [Fusarium albosuccineum]|uniref:Uncharacterized protein n=1 Tax=Fusarium albosuccineum TaxID=1237068 RepID=A0A8H4KZX1_9HYPO|nr:hypothetical protein FALBO_14554 [Fusarium albosuccineum]